LLVCNSLSVGDFALSQVYDKVTSKNGRFMGLLYKPDFEEIKKRWIHFWNREVYKRPVIMTACRKNPSGAPLPDCFGLRYYNAVHGKWDEQLALFHCWMQEFVFLGEAVPSFSADFGPDQFAAFFGAQLKFSENSKSTSWVKPIVDDWNNVLPLVFDENGQVFQKLLAYTRKIADDSKGKYLVGDIDKHSNADTLSALRGPMKFCMDFYDCPDLVERAMLDVRKAYSPICDAVFHASDTGEKRGTCHYGFWHPGKFGVVQSDFICMLGKEHFRKYVLPALEEEVEYYDASYFHLDGPGALKHLDDILALKKLGVLQWQPGDGEKANFQWIDVLQKAQKAGKAVHVFGNSQTPLMPGTVKQIHKELNPALVVYDGVLVKSVHEFEELAAWLEKNT